MLTASLAEILKTNKLTTIVFVFDLPGPKTNEVWNGAIVRDLEEDVNERYLT